MQRSGAKAAILAALLAMAVALFVAPGAGAAVTLPEKFEDQTVWGGLNKPMIVKFAPDGEVFVGEKGGQIWVYENVDDKTPELFANLAKPVYDYEDHGLLGMAIDPLWALGQRYVYVLYTYNHKLAYKGTQSPQVADPRAEPLAWPEYKGPEGSFEEDKCPEGEEVNEHKIPKEELGCEVSGLVVKLKADPAGSHAEPSAAAPEEEVLLEGWCQQATTHSVGDLGFGPEGALYVSGGEGAMYSEADYGQFGNPCQDPVEESGGEVVRLTALGGSLRSQSVMRNHSLANHPTLLSGAVLRVNPNTGQGLPGNPFYSSSEPNAKRIVAFGFRQPWRFTIDQRLGELYVSNVGNGSFEEIERLTLGSSAPYNGGWPCYEGGENGKPVRNYGYAGEFPPGTPNPSIQYCIDQYEAENNGNQETETPFYSYPHNGPAVPGDQCYQGKPLATDVSGNVFNEGTAYSRAYHDAFFFSDAIRGCIYVMQSGSDGKPDPETGTTFLSGVERFSFPAVDMEQGPEGNIFYVQLFEKFGNGPGSVHRIVYTGTSEGEEIEREEREQREREEKEQREREEREARERKEREERERKEKESTPPVTPTPPPTYAPPQIKKRPGKTTTQLSAKFVFAGQGGTKFRCKLDGKGFSSCRSPRTYKNLKVGKHSFRVYSADPAGNRLSANRVFTWNIVPRS
ncbi:MAG: PQQ-dependent sugar dehydrogenase [Actinobacteria bacterium]|nr:PQQ-dependent sugar dehydrogenase [Actinomycetota bacterium]